MPAGEEVATATGEIRGGDARGPDGDVAALWDAYRDGDGAQARDRLILHYSPLVKFVATRLSGRLPSSVEVGDLVSFGLFGLIDAIEGFDPSRGFRFEAYARQRIRGAILDELRALDWVPRSIRAKSRRIERATEHLRGRLRREPSDREVAEELGVSLEDLEGDLLQVSYATLVGLEATPRDGGGDPVSLADTLGTAAMERFEDAEARFLLRRAIESLPERDRGVVVLMYFEGMTLAEAGEVLGVSESRVCQIHGRAIARLRAYLDADGRLEAAG